MNRYVLAAGGVLLALAAALLVWALMLAGPRTYQVTGRVAGFGNDPHRVFIEHEAIEGYMPAMTMPFRATDTAALQALEIGDAVGFQMHVASDSVWIDKIARLPDAAVARHPAGPPPVKNAGDATVLREGDRVPNFAFVAQTGDTLKLAELPGESVLLTFIYTRCPLPTFCPLMSRRFAALQPRLREIAGDDVHLLSISFDPSYDTPAVLRDYASRYTDRLDTWTFATGTSAQIDRITGLLGVFPQTQGGQLIHNLTTALIGPQGRLVEVWRGNDWTAEDVAAAVRAVN